MKKELSNAVNYLEKYGDYIIDEDFFQDYSDKEIITKAKDLKKSRSENKYQFIHGKDVFDSGDNNNGLIWGVEEISDFPDYVEWYSSLNKLLDETKSMNITNREQFLSNFKKTHKVSKSGKIRKIPEDKFKWADGQIHYERINKKYGIYVWGMIDIDDEKVYEVRISSRDKPDSWEETDGWYNSKTAIKEVFYAMKKEYANKK